MVYLLNTNIKDIKNFFVSLHMCYGLSERSSLCLISKFGVSILSNYKKLPEFVKVQIEFNIDKVVENVLGVKIGKALRFQEEVFFDKLINLKCYRTLRHKQYLPVRGQRTHSNAKTQKKKLKGRLKNIKIKK
jgi:small subunit ribosomal protein S13